MLNYLYEGWGFDNDDPRLWTVASGKTLQDMRDDGYSTEGMKTLAQQGTIAYDEPLETETSEEHNTEADAFFSEHGSCYTDLRQEKCNCE